MTTIDGTIALVTGGQRGLGRAFVAELLRRGATKVYATARAPEPSDDPRVVPLALEVTDPDSVAAVAAQAADVAVIVNNAGVLRPAPLLEAEMADVVATFETNVFGPLRIAQAFAPILAANGGGALVDIHSVLSWSAGAAAYGASKAAFWSLTNSLRIELAEQRTQVVGVHLGFADTDMVKALAVAKIDPAQVAATVFDGVEAGAQEVLVDELTRRVKAALSGPVADLALPVRR
ncbi:SDR family oxidoreductase [Nocardia arthritidis]|uniref:SDR family NAD(P)-dependent oxidoreductase n=1 Tax=Nocardia arthritidis TaxID=228602 RepID=A0A6G9YI67_9NOCA|nr:SDR family oxidoreductase [Nocardia arthritidis]QIS12902.1 SDR family NAD(P)-dependent oxidoreductase [Nocardia arthritidis]